MFLTMRAVWALLPGIALAIIAPRPATVLAWAGVVLVLIVIDVACAPSPRLLRASRSVGHGIRLGESITSTLTVTNTGRRAMPRPVTPPEARWPLAARPPGPPTASSGWSARGRQRRPVPPG